MSFLNFLRQSFQNMIGKQILSIYQRKSIVWLSLESIYACTTIRNYSQSVCIITICNNRVTLTEWSSYFRTILIYTSIQYWQNSFFVHLARFSVQIVVFLHSVWSNGSMLVVSSTEGCFVASLVQCVWLPTGQEEKEGRQTNPWKLSKEEHLPRWHA